MEKTPTSSLEFPVRGRKGGVSPAEDSRALAAGASADGGGLCISASLGVSSLAENVWFVATETTDIAGFSGSRFLG